MKPSLFQALVVALLLLLLGLVTTLVVQVAPMRDTLRALAYQRQVSVAADALAADARDEVAASAARSATQQLLDQARERLRKEQAPAPAFHIIPDH
ncbi:hypothetical protein [Burkholderia gladioli]|uniref:hypothetical protein n=1 Tax=Burkholderia gladioli TaxID=28095 RepID=UPI00163E7BF2|nr:hypothetical protein [Burkholderia gladioli]